MTSTRSVRILVLSAVVVVLAAGLAALLVVDRLGTDSPVNGSRSCGSTDRPQADDWVTRDGDRLTLGGRPWRFSGVNAFWLGLRDEPDGRASYPTEAEIDDAMAAVRDSGARMVRATTLGVSVGTPSAVEPALGRFNDAAFAPIDHAVAAARRCGLRLMIPLTDRHAYYHGGIATFAGWFGETDARAFYTDPRIVSAFHDYIAHLLRHVNPLTGVALGDDPTIAVWETGNELWDAPTSWTGRTASAIKAHAPRALVADGSTASRADVTASGVDQADVDIVDAHYYPTTVEKMTSDAAYVAAKDKVFVVGEYPLTGSGLRAWTTALAANRDVAGDLAWSLLPYDASGNPEPHDDGYTFHLPGATADERRQTATLSAHCAAMRRSGR